jgi:hypothetical protein
MKNLNSIERRPPVTTEHDDAPLQPSSQAALYTFARAAGAQVLPLALVTSTMRQTEQELEIRVADGTADALRALDANWA